jgi:hypothetical protein
MVAVTAALGLVLLAGCSRDSEPASGRSSSSDASVFRNLGKR